MTPIYPLLGLLVNGARHGYDLKRVVDTEFAPFWRIDFAQLYRSLAKMTRVGWVKVHVEPSGEGPARKVYTLTARGRQVFAAWLAEPASDRAEFFVKLRLATATNTPVARLLAEQRHAFEIEHTARVAAQRAARATRDVGRLVLMDAAVRETDNVLAALDLSAALTHAPRRTLHATETAPLVIIGSDDPLLAHLARALRVATRTVGSLHGLLAIAQHEADVAGVHLLDTTTGEYNVPFVRHLAPEEDCVLVNLAVRENGLMIARGNPKKIRGVRDLARAEIRFINRQRGAGTRLLLHAKLRAARIDPRTLPDWEHTVTTHEAVAETLLFGAADVGPGLRAVADTHGLDFIPLGEERYDLVIPRDAFESSRTRAILDTLTSKTFHQFAATLSGYDLTHSGQVIARVH